MRASLPLTRARSGTCLQSLCPFPVPTPSPVMESVCVRNILKLLDRGDDVCRLVGKPHHPVEQRETCVYADTNSASRVSLGLFREARPQASLPGTS